MSLTNPTTIQKIFSLYHDLTVGQKVFVAGAVFVIGLLIFLAYRLLTN